MIRIIPADDKIKQEFGLSEQAYAVLDGDKVCGVCEYTMAPPQCHIISAVCDDMQLLDGLLRQTLSHCLDCECPTATFSDDVRDKLFSLKIIKKNNEHTLDILEFFTKLNGCEIF